MSASKHEFKKTPIGNGHLVIIHAEPERWEEIGRACTSIEDPALSGLMVLFLKPGETIESVSDEDLAQVGFERIKPLPPVGGNQ